MPHRSALEIRDAQDADLPGILAIHNQAVRETTASWNEREVDLENRRGWLAEKRRQDHPVLIARRGGELFGYASYGPFRAFDGYRHTVEHSVYVRPEAQRQGVGRRLLEALIARAADQGLHVMVAAIEAENAPSIALHTALGFRETGRMPQVGAKFGRWLDLVLMQRMLNQADKPPGQP